jgi:probable rRNA maturation factor
MLLVEVVNETDLPVDEDAVARAALLVLEAEGVGSGELALAFVDEAAIAGLNESYRGLEGPTDVLSFPGDDEDDHWPDPEMESGVVDRPTFLGDVLICPAVARDNALDDGIPLNDELRRLLVHGILHLLGHDHERDEGQMRMREEVVLGDTAWEALPLLLRE